MLDIKIAELESRLQKIAQTQTQAALASSLGMEDQVLLDVIARLGLSIDVFTLNTGRLHSETLALATTSQTRYGISIQRVEPQTQAVLHYIKQHGENAFYDSVALRKACCAIRKVEPLSRALHGRSAWITGQRRAQSTTRTELPLEDFDAAHGIRKFNPLADWTGDDVLAYVRRYAVPVNPMHSKGYPSIGCEPCTRAIKAGEDERAGRWWWENADSKECGLHIQPATPA